MDEKGRWKACWKIPGDKFHRKTREGHRQQQDFAAQAPFFFWLAVRRLI